MQFSTFTHGNALAIETPNALAGYFRVGWGTQMIFPAPVPQQTSFGIVYDEIGPGTWLHMPLTTTLATFGLFGPRLASVTLLFSTEHCRITDVHVYDGATIIHRFEGALKGNFLGSRDPRDIDPERHGSDSATFGNTLKLPAPHKVFPQSASPFMPALSNPILIFMDTPAGPRFPRLS